MNRRINSETLAIKQISIIMLIYDGTIEYRKKILAKVKLNQHKLSLNMYTSNSRLKNKVISLLPLFLKCSTAKI